MLTISKLKRSSVSYYIDTAKAAGRASSDLQKANGGLGSATPNMRRAPQCGCRRHPCRGAVGGFGRRGRRQPPGWTRLSRLCAPHTGLSWLANPEPCCAERSSSPSSTTCWAPTPVRDVQGIKSKEQPKGAQALTADQPRDLLAKLRASEACRQRDLTDPTTLLIATGLHRSELLALQWTDFDERPGHQLTQLPQEGRDAHRRRWTVRSHRCRPSRARQGVDDPGPLYEPWSGAQRGGRSAGQGRCRQLRSAINVE